MSNLIDKLKITDKNLKQINDFLVDPENPLIKSVIEIINKYGTPEEINAKAKEAGKLENLMKRLKEGARKEEVCEARPGLISLFGFLFSFLLS